MEVRFFLTGQDLWTFQKYVLRRTGGLVMFVVLLAIIFILGLAITSLSPSSDLLISLSPVFLALLGVILLVYLLLWRTRIGAARYLALQGEQIITISPEGFRQRNNFTDSLIFWRAFKSFTAEKDNLYFIVHSNRMLAHIIPRRAFATPQDAEAFLALAQTYWAHGPAAPPAGPAGTSTAYEHLS
jgi:hypothetical protein